jgi:hypothetical protein
VVDCIYIAASALDSRYTRICVASVRDFYPAVPIRLLAGGPLRRGLEEELRRYWNVSIANFPRRNYGWGFVKLEPLFRPPGERFLILDSDTVMTGPVLGLADGRDEDLIVDDEVQSPERAKAIYYDWAKAAEEGNPIKKPEFLFNTGQWFGKSGILSREDFSGLVEWGVPPRLVNPRVFKNGDQGVLNFVVNEQARLGKIRVARVPLMRWPGHGMQGLDAGKVAKRTAAPLVVHWAGMKKARQRDMVGADLLAHFEANYYKRLPAGRVRRILDVGRDYLLQWLHSVRVRLTLALRKRMAKAHWASVSQGLLSKFSTK